MAISSVPATNDDKLVIFISYSRNDVVEADLLADALTARGFSLLIDRRNLEFGEKWQAELSDFIRAADTAIWLVSPHSVASPWVNWELDEIAKNAKRLVPVVVGDTPRDQIPRQIGEIQLLPAEGQFDLRNHFDALVRVLETDFQWLKRGSRIADRAHEWVTHGRNQALLLRGASLIDAEQWKDRRPAKAPAPTANVVDLLMASRRAATQRQRWWLGGSLAAALGAIALAGYAEWQRRSAEITRDAAVLAQSKVLAEFAHQKIEQGNAVTGMLLALEALPDTSSGDGDVRRRKHWPLAEHALRAAWQVQREVAVLAGHSRSLNGAVFSSDGRHILTLSDDHTARLWNAVGEPITTFVGHRDHVRSVAISPDGSRIVTGSKDKTARVWSVDGRPLFSLSGHTGALTSTVFSPDGSLVLTASQDNTARIWSADGRLLKTLMGHGAVVWSAVFSSDGRHILTASHDKTARIWNADGELQFSLAGHEGNVWSAQFSSDGSRILTTSDDRTARVWSADGKLLATLAGVVPGGGVTAVFADEPVRSLAARTLTAKDKVPRAVFSSDGTRILTASDDKSVKLWSVEGRLLQTLTGHDSGVRSAAFSPDGSRIVTASDDKTVRMWTAEGTPIATMIGHEAPLLSAIFSVDGRRILTASEDFTARIWSTEARTPHVLTEREKTRQTGYGVQPEVEYSPDGQRLLTNFLTRTARLWTADGALVAALEGHTGEVTDASFSPDGNRILTASLDKTARLRSADGNSIAVLSGHQGEVWRAMFSPDGKRILTTSRDRTARLWDAAGAQLAVLNHKAPVRGAAFSRNGDRILTVTSESSAHLWSVDGAALADLGGNSHAASAVFSPDGQLILTHSMRSMRLWRSDGSLLTSLSDGLPPPTRPWQRYGRTVGVFSPDGNRILTNASDSRFFLWSAEGKMLASPTGHSVNLAVFSPDGQRIVTTPASSSGDAQLWDSNGKWLATLVGHSASIESVVFSKDGRRILTASRDRTARLWTADGQPLETLTGSGGSLYNAMFAPDGRHILTTASDMIVRLWQSFSSTQTIVERGHTVVPRCLTPAERDMFHLQPTPPNWCLQLRKWPYTTDAFLPESVRLLIANKVVEARAILDAVTANIPEAGKLVPDFLIASGESLKRDYLMSDDVVFAEALSRDPTAGTRIEAARTRAAEAQKR